ncbi:MAG: hypothetical protein HN396_04970 [Gemmatimonadales bacterium]|nr:hypothetical protein [Gemmatimonadales bacterium]MBT3500412.1 hypothetical protein [Gemmatimonadales bacterium]MBT3773590.1 hypothetical protein [Gemmatimonadales bacterium]MBT4439144.1 hypothetical protein [Gemmatimonadales bacterium]MBT5043514.1 hypothetical protein [Gemmatimonadales bacterium]
MFNSSRHRLFLENRAFSEQVPDGALVLDAGAGEGPYRELFPPERLEKQVDKTTVDGVTIHHGLFGMAQFNFFTRRAIEAAGGWHPLFSEHCRWGHTEHSYRVARTGLAPAPFNLVPSTAKCFIWHFPPAVTSAPSVRMTEDDIPHFEAALIRDGLDHVPVTTLSDYSFNGRPMDGTDRLAGSVSAATRYPLAEAEEVRACRSSFLLWQAQHASNWFSRLTLLTQAIALSPRNPSIRHYIKMTLQGARPR